MMAKVLNVSPVVNRFHASVAVAVPYGSLTGRGVPVACHVVPWFILRVCVYVTRGPKTRDISTHLHYMVSIAINAIHRKNRVE
jgi:hypothetical protein